MKSGTARLPPSRRKFVSLAVAILILAAASSFADQAGFLGEFVKSADATTSPLSGRWRAESIRSRGVIGDPQTVIEIATDGRVTGSGGCNRIRGKAKVMGAYLRFGPMISTRMACAPAIMDQESRFLSALGDTRLWRFDEQRDKLILVDAKGITVLRLART
jgi:putative lipoprotein